MSGTAAANTWQEMNQRYLSAALAVVRGYLSQHAALAQGEAAFLEATNTVRAAKQQYQDVSGSVSPASALERLCALFNLSPFERDVVLLCAGMELDGAFPGACAAAQRDPQRAFATFSLALAALPDAHWSALLPSAPLRYWRLIEFAASQGSSSAPLTTRALRIDERVLHYLAGIKHLDERLASLVEPVHFTHELMPTHQAVAERVASRWSPSADSPSPVILLYGRDDVTAFGIATRASSSVGLALHALHSHDIPATTNDLHAFIRLWEREAALGSRALLLDCNDETTDPIRESAISDLIEKMRGPLIVTSRERRRVRRRSVASFEVPQSPSHEERAVWTVALGQVAHCLDGQLDILMSQFNLNVPAIYSVTTESSLRDDTTSSFDLLWEACRNQTRCRLDELAQRIEPAANWCDLVLPEAQTGMLRDIVVHVKHRPKVYETWGFASKGTRGLGISALFIGASGTGKTMAAEVLARELRLDLYRIDLSAVVSKYIGETEKNLRRVFDAAEAGGAILLFDEADALFGKRSEVKDSHDRYANIEVSYLLQRMECYRGLAILTTNLKSALDAAFLRRIRFIVQFPFPDAEQRSEIWRRIFPVDTPTDGLKNASLAQLSISGGCIRNMALNAAFLAADKNEKVSMLHLLQAARCEYAKLEKPLTDSETAGWEEGLESPNERADKYSP